MITSSDLSLGFAVSFAELYQQAGLAKLDQIFLDYLNDAEPELCQSLILARSSGRLPALEHSKLITTLAPRVEDFIAKLFGIEAEVLTLAARHHELAVIFRCKRLFVQRRAVKEYANFDFADYDPVTVDELQFAQEVMAWLIEPDKYKGELDAALKYAAWAVLSVNGKIRHQHGALFKVPKKIDNEHLLELVSESCAGVNILKSPHTRHRDGFSLTDTGIGLAAALDQASYCIFCHNQGKDSCSKGFRDDGFKPNAFGEAMTGCPLEEKISEMNNLKADGYALGALATAVIDNPMLAATGHRICNDCMKSCIYQKQEPVNIPKVETQTLNDVLDLSWGFEIYSLLTRWNPLNIANPICKPDTGYKILVAGLGPAGFTLAHYLLNEGHTVVGIDGLKIEPFSHCDDVYPIKHINQLFEDLDKRTAQGFGGVAEYGITVRWNKNYLKIIRLLLERRQNFRMFGGVRFGSSITHDTAVELGFDHIALAFGAGKPTMLSTPNALASGVRMASDFLMALQLTGAAREDLIANLQVRLPILVIGGGLTAIDTATEAVCYYVRQVEKFYARHLALVKEYGVEYVNKDVSKNDQLIAQEFIAHAKLFAEERKSNKPNFIKIINQLGGVSVVYRKKMTEAPCYRLNHEELQLALEEGIGFIENAHPHEVAIDEERQAVGLIVKINGEECRLPARTIFIAAGTSPNTVLQREDPRNFKLDKKYFQAIDEEGHVLSLQRLCKPDDNRILTSLGNGRVLVSFFGDLHPSYAGNVVKAMASAKNGYREITRLLESRHPQGDLTRDNGHFLSTLTHFLTSTVQEVIQLTPNIIEIVIKSPLAAQAFQPGQFYRLQNYEQNAMSAKNLKLVMEGIAVTGAWVDKERGLISVIVLEMGGSSSLCRYLRPGERVVLMGPTGHPTEIKPNENVMLIGGGLGNAVLFSIAKAFKEAGSRVLYFAGYKQASDRYKMAEIEAYADQVVWCCDSELLPVGRDGDLSFHGNIVEAIGEYARQHTHSLRSINRIIAIGSDSMMAAVSAARNSSLSAHLNPNHKAFASINSPMQCMMKEICGQCLQKQIDSVTGLETYVYSCFNQDQEMSNVDFAHLKDRLRQNSLQENLTAKTIAHVLRALGARG